MLCRCHGGSQATGRAGSKRRSKKDRVTSFARSIAGTQVKRIKARWLYPVKMKIPTPNCNKCIDLYV